MNNEGADENVWIHFVYAFAIHMQQNKVFLWWQLYIKFLIQ